MSAVFDTTRLPAASATTPTFPGAPASASTKGMQEVNKEVKKEVNKEVKKGKKGKKNWVRRPTIIKGEIITFSSQKEAAFVVNFLGKHALKRKPPVIPNGRKGRCARRRANRRAKNEAEEKKKKEKGEEEGGR